MTMLQALSVAFSFTGQSLPDAALAEMACELSAYPETDVFLALKRCRAELKSIKYSDILDRLPNGFLGPEEAWAVVSRGMQNEALTVVWTDEMRAAYGVAAPLADDPVAARMAFREAYQRAVSAARARNAQPSWSVSRGTDRADQALQITEAVKAGRLSQAYAATMLPQVVDRDAARRVTEQLTIGSRS